ncbi:MAG: hypothetical protein V1837_01380 [Candidatus Woesearchaeota archaeon]
MTTFYGREVPPSEGEMGFFQKAGNGYVFISVDEKTYEGLAKHKPMPAFYEEVTELRLNAECQTSWKPDSMLGIEMTPAAIQKIENLAQWTSQVVEALSGK